jgi:hypothetical protein
MSARPSLFHLPPREQPAGGETPVAVDIKDAADIIVRFCSGTAPHKEAAEMLRHLNAILKTTLQRSAPEKVPFSQELELVEDFLALEQVRFADRLRLDIRVSPDALASRRALLTQEQLSAILATVENPLVTPIRLSNSTPCPQ